jgi:chromosome segregation protein
MLKALELVGFKSFADKTRFEFPPGISVVVGPNGSGKSNIVDAIKWVLGEQSVKTLRGKEMADVIFNGSATRRGLNAAETTVTFDNSRGLLPIDAAEVHVTRRVYRSGEGEYLINRQPCRLRDIRELFWGTGVATEAYSVIEQGKVDVLLQSSPRDRRMIFEEAAGISRFKIKKIESLRRLERARVALERSLLASLASRQMQPLVATSTHALVINSVPPLISATATTNCGLARRTRVDTRATLRCGTKLKLATSMSGFSGANTRMRFT